VFQNKVLSKIGIVNGILRGKCLGRFSLGRLRRRQEDIVFIDLMERGCERGNWMELPQDNVLWQALVLTFLNLFVLLLPEI
jgi:hypothetical protein